MGFDRRERRGSLGSEDLPMMRLMTFLLVIWGSAALADRPAIPGEDDAAFVEARSAWLDGDDHFALQKLGGLAADGNTAAQILLARIGEEPNMHRQVTRDLSRKDRIGLLRQEGGLSGTSWLEAAEGNSELARALVLRKVAFSSEDGGEGGLMAPEAMEAVRLLLQYNEVALATDVAFKLFDGGFLREIVSLLDEYGDELDRIAKILLYVAYTSLDPDFDLSENTHLVEGVEPEDIFALRHMHPQVLKENADLRKAVVLFAEMVQPWTPLREMCEVSCPNSYNTCLIAGVTSMGVARRYPFASPLDSLVPEEDYWRSARIRGDVARKLFEIQPDFKIGASFDQCFADTVTALAQ
jgi:hypothetical protein